MNFKKMLKNVAIISGVYALSNASFQYGKGFFLKYMKDHNSTLDEMIDIVKEGTKNNLFDNKINYKIIEFAAREPKY